MLNTTGTNISVATVAKMRPPMTARPSGAFCSPPSPRPSAIGAMPMIIANAVISTGRKRTKPASVAAAIDAGFVRFRPVLMTALAMIIGMAPMALGLGEGGEQNAPLGRAVIGGLIFATVATLMFVPVVFSMIHKRAGETAAYATGEPHVA